MTTELISFKLLIHGYTLDKSFFKSIGDNINNPGFAVVLFNFPAFIISSSEKLDLEQVGMGQWIRFGNGKSTVFEMSESQIQGFLNDRPLILNFIDSEHQQMRIFSKTIVTLRSFRDSIKTYYQRDQENWKRRIFVMFDETRNEVGKIDLSISLVKRRKDTFNSTINTKPQTLVYQQNVPLNPQDFPVYANKTINGFSKTENLSNKHERPKTSGFESQKSFQEFEPFESQTLNNNSTLKSFQTREGSQIAAPVTSLQTIVGGYYCPPVMLLQKKKKTVRFIGNENKIKMAKPTAIQQSTDFLRSKSPQFTHTKSLFGSTGLTGAEKMSQSYEDSTNRPVVLLSNKESERIVDLLKLKDQKGEDFTLVDLLIKELVTLRSGSQQHQPIDFTAKAESLRIGALRSKEPQKDVKVGVPKKRSSFSKELVEKNKENSDQNLITNYSPKRNRLDSFKGLIKGRDIVNEVIKETYEEANLPEEEYSQDFESLSVSQSMPYSLGQNGKKETAPALGKLKPTIATDKVESIDESYPEDFEQDSAASASHNFLSKYQNKYLVKTGGVKDIEESKDISEEILESGSRTISNSQPFTRKDYGRKDSKFAPDSGIRNSKVFSDYSEDFEALSEENY